MEPKCFTRARCAFVPNFFKVHVNIIILYSLMISFLVFWLQFCNISFDFNFIAFYFFMAAVL